jgi:hypothetical protein
MKKDLEVALFKTDYEDGRLQPTPAGHPQLATSRANYFLLVLLSLPLSVFSSFFLLFSRLSEFTIPYPAAHLPF